MLQYAVVDGVLYHLEPDHTLRVAPPAENFEWLFKEGHEWPYFGHLHEAKIQGQLIGGQA